MDIDHKKAAAHYAELNRMLKERACAGCIHVRETEKSAAYWKCAAPQGEIHFTSPVSGAPEVKRVWNYCEGERSSSSTGCGEAGAWWEPK